MLHILVHWDTWASVFCCLSPFMVFLASWFAFVKLFDFWSGTYWWRLFRTTCHIAPLWRMKTNPAVHVSECEGHQAHSHTRDAGHVAGFQGKTSDARRRRWNAAILFTCRQEALWSRGPTHTHRVQVHWWRALHVSARVGSGFAAVIRLCLNRMFHLWIY